MEVLFLFIYFSFVLWTLQAVGRTPCVGDQPCRKAAVYTGQHKHRRRRPDIDTSSGIRALEREKIIDASESAAAVIE
jgi:hypothetical protein